MDAGNRLRVRASGPFSGLLRPPSDKSLTHRAYLLAALAESPGSRIDAIHTEGPGAVNPIPIPQLSESVIVDPLRGQDCESTRACLAALGVPSYEVLEREIRVEGGRTFADDPVTLDCGNSGTTMRLLCGVLAGIPGVKATLIGDASLSRRPMGRVVEPLRQMGAQIEGDRAPVQLVGQELTGIEYISPVASAQVKSCVLLAGLRAQGETWVTEPALSRDHTETMLQALGVELMFRGDLTVGLKGGQTWRPFDFKVPADISSAAFTMVAAALRPGSKVTATHVGINPTRTGILQVLAQCGVEVEVKPRRRELGEMIADLTVTGPERLNPFRIHGSLVPRLIDEIPVLAVLATQAHGTSVIQDARELRVKETDRIAVVSEALRRMGAQVETFDDGMAITGPTPLTGASVDSAGDHRIGMSFTIAGLIAKGETEILNADHIATSYPDFVRHIRRIGGDIDEA